MRIDMVNNMVTDVNVKADNVKDSSTIDITSKDTGNKFSDILKNLKSEKAAINKVDTFDKYIKVEKLQVKSKGVDKNSFKIETKSKDVEKVDDEEEVEEKIDNLSTEQIIQCLNIITDKMQELSEGTDINVDNISIESINTELKQALMTSIESSNGNNLDVNFNKLINIMQQDTQDDSAVNIVNNLLEMLNKDNMNEILDKENLSLADALLNKLGAKLENENTMGNENGFLKNLVSEVKNDINMLLSQKDSQPDIDINKIIDTSKVVDLKDTKLQSENIVSEPQVEETVMVSNVTSTENNKVEDVNIKNVLSYDEKNIVTDNNLSKENSDEGSNDEDSTARFSKDEKILNSILKGSNSNNNSFAMPVTTTVIQNNGDMQVTQVQVINKDTMVPDVIKTVKYMTTNSMKEMIVKINPNNLGEVTIKLIEENGIMKMNIKAASKETYALLSQQAEQMKSQLNEQNIRIHDVNISLYEEDTTFFKEGEFNNNSFQENKRRNNSNNVNNEEFDDEQDNSINNIDINAINMLA